VYPSRLILVSCVRLSAKGFVSGMESRILRSALLLVISTIGFWGYFLGLRQEGTRRSLIVCRVVSMPGDTLSVGDGVVLMNDQPFRNPCRR
jgi:hypothetical protein